MSFALYQIVILALAAIMILHGLKSFLSKASGQTILKFLVRLIVWGGMALVVAFPQISNMLAKIIGIQGNINAVILTGFLLVFLMIFKLLSAIEPLEQQITALTRTQAIEDIIPRNTLDE